MSPTARALLEELLGDPEGMRELAGALAEYLPAQQAEEPDRWLTSAEAAAYLGMSTNALHRLTAQRLVPFEQDGPGCKCWFKRSDLEDWRRNGRADTPGNMVPASLPQ